MKMSETMNCPYGDNCPQVLANKNTIELITQKIELQNTYLCEKMDSMASDIKEVKNFLNEKLDEKIDARVEEALNKYQAKILRWIVCTLLGSGGLSAVIAFLIK